MFERPQVRGVQLGVEAIGIDLGQSVAEWFKTDSLSLTAHGAHGSTGARLTFSERTSEGTRLTGPELRELFFVLFLERLSLLNRSGELSFRCQRTVSAERIAVPTLEVVRHLL